MTTEQRTDDSLLGGLVRLRQPDTGYRAAIDPIMLAAAVPATSGNRVLDLGCGAGAVALCLAARVEGVIVHGLDIQAGAIELAMENARASALSNRVTFAAGDILHLPDDVAAEKFDHVMTNPPYLKAGASRPPPDPTKMIAHVEGEAGLADWVRVAHDCVKPAGTMTFIHRYDRRDELADAFASLNGALVICPLWTRPDRSIAKRIIAQWSGGAVAPTRESHGFVLHRADGAYTPDAEMILRDAGALPPGVWA